MIITPSYFTGPIAIANGQDVAPNSELLGNGVKLQDFIDRYEREALISVLGYQLAEAFTSQFTHDPNTNTWTFNGTKGDKWDELLNGKEYSVSGKDYRWRGLTYAVAKWGNGGSELESLLAYYVYCKFIEDDYLNHTGTGFQREDAVNATGMGYSRNYARAFNAFVDGVEFNEGTERQVKPVSLYDFIQDMNSLDPTTYPDWEYQRFRYVNRFGL